MDKSKKRLNKYYFIINPFAGKKPAKKLVGFLIDNFKKESVEFEYAYTEKTGHATELARNAVLQKYDFVVAVGGDGTVNEVANGLKGSDVVMGIIPVGSGNGLARELKIPINPKEAAEVLIQGNRKHIDLWQINNRIFLCAAGFGFDAVIAGKMANSTFRGFWGYIWLTIKESMAFKPVSVNLSLGNQSVRQSVFLVSFANASQLGNNAFISPGAKTDDGLLDVVLIHPMSKLFYPVLGISLFLRNIHKFNFFKMYRVNSVVINNASTNLFHVDGESVQMNFPVQINLLKNQLKVCVP